MGVSLPTYARCPTCTIISIRLWVAVCIHQAMAKKWAEIESAIERLPDPSPMTVKLIQTIGLLGIVGEVSLNLKASKALLCYALDDGLGNYPKAKLMGLSNRLRVRWRRWRDVLLPFTAATTMPMPYGREAMSTSNHGSAMLAANLDPNLRLPDCSFGTYATATPHCPPAPLCDRHVALLRSPIHRP